MLPNIIFIFAILGILLVILRHLPEVVAEEEEQRETPAVEKLSQKGLPAVAISKLAGSAKLWKKKMWNFLLETKDLKPTAVAGYKIKKMFGNKASSAEPVAVTPPPQLPREVRDEQYFLDQIKLDPKNLHNYSELGKFYMERGNIADAKDIYQYLTQHDPAHAEFFSKLGMCYYKLGEYARAVEQYKKSLTLDSTQPNRYYNLGMSLQANGDLPAAVEAFNQAIALESNNTKYYISLSDLYMKLGNRNDAKVTLRKARKIDPEDNKVLEKLKQF